ncbi:MAG: M20/M25/M40 family metallo-hydrolase, partial [bacterium]|nr:M20/M25/M40 family metallo-hydrolase [bacterium]
KAGFKTSIYSKNENRPNLIARLTGKGRAAPFLMYGHVDVVPPGKGWKYPAFSGTSAENCLWGRGSLDMKGGISMMMAALLKAKNENIKPAGDIVFAILSDEESGSDFGAKFLVEKYPEQFKGIHYAIGEFGGFPIYVGKTKFYPIQIGEKQICWMKAKVYGPGGHGSRRVTGTATAQLGQIL